MVWYILWQNDEVVDFVKMVQLIVQIIKISCLYLATAIWQPKQAYMFVYHS